MRMKSFACALLIPLSGQALVVPFNLSHAVAASSSGGSRLTPFTRSAGAPLASFTVTNLNDSGPGSLRQAIDDANANVGMDAITLNVTGTITLTSGELNIEEDLNIIGPGASILTINGNNASRIFEIQHTVMISDLTISNGSSGSSGIGGSILNRGTLTITNSTLSSNAAGSGGGVFNEGIITISNSTMSGNSASGLGGGAIYNHLGLVTLNNSTLSGNFTTSEPNVFHSGGAIYNDRGTVTVINTTLSGNSAKDQGGGIYTLSETLTISNCTLSNNSAASGGGIRNDGTVKVKNSIAANSPSGENCAGSGTYDFSGVNFSTDASCSGFTQVPSTGPGGLNLGLLQNNGGTTQTHALPPGSVAIDAVTECADVNGNPVTTDQRGVPRPLDGDGDGVSRCDVGAYEAPTLVSFDLCIQDDSNGYILKIKSTTGDYQFNNCSGFTISGTGRLIVKGNVLTLQHFGADSRVLAKIDSSLKKGTASVQVFAQGTTFTIIDRNTSNNICACTVR